MIAILSKNKRLTNKTLIATLAIVFSIILPQLFHIVGNVSGMGAGFGAALLPMHLPVLLAGFIGGPWWTSRWHYYRFTKSTD